MRRYRSSLSGAAAALGAFILTLTPFIVTIALLVDDPVARVWLGVAAGCLATLVALWAQDRRPEPGRPQPGICGDQWSTGTTPGGLIGQTGPCTLDAGHAGWHRSDSGAEWSAQEGVMP